MTGHHFFFRLTPPRPTFAQDMTAQERALMGEHAAYMKVFFDSGAVLGYGPVLDPAGSFGVALLEMTDLAEAERFAQGDPTIKAGMNSYTICPMIIAASQPSRATHR
jgi:uncharacterized protein YciI